MADINITSIMKKTNQFIKSKQGKELQKRAYAEFSKEGRDKTPSGQPVVTITEMREAAQILIDMYKQYSHALPESVARNLSSIQIIEETFDTKNNNQQIIIGFPNEETLRRDSLYNTDKDGKRVYTGDGVLNIVSLFDTGYTASGSVYGFWETHDRYVHSLKARAGEGFMSFFINEFNEKYGDKYLCKADIISEYRNGIRFYSKEWINS